MRRISVNPNRTPDARTGDARTEIATLMADAATALSVVMFEACRAAPRPPIREMTPVLTAMARAAAERILDAYGLPHDRRLAPLTCELLGMAEVLAGVMVGRACAN